MKRFFCILLSLAILISVTACSNGDKEENSSMEPQTDTMVSEIQTESQMEKPSVSSADSETDQEDANKELQTNKNQEEKEMVMNIQIGEHVLTATLVQNSSTEALVEMLSEGPVTINMNDYANMEKVGSLPASLPRNDKQISTAAGDLILYQGNSFVIYYDTNAWSLTRLGKIENVTQQELKEILGSGSVTAVLSLPAK